jgi:predicted nucleic acid-binding protein
MAAQPEPVVSNSSPLIALATIGRLALLKSLFEEIAIPKAVYEEIVIQGEGEPGGKEVAEAEWIHTVSVEDRLAVDLLQESLDMGESEAIVLGQQLGARYVLLDDELARAGRLI